MGGARFFIENYKFTIVLTVGMVLIGLGGLLQLNTEQFPNVEIGAVQITTSYPGASAEDIESKITKPLEDEIRGVTGLKEVKSVSQPGLSRIITQVDIDRYDVEEVVSDLQRAVDRAPNLPADLDSPPDFVEMKSSEFPIIELVVVGGEHSRQRNEIADELKEELEDVNGVKGVELVGFHERQFNIFLKQKALDRYHVGVNEVTAKIAAQNLTIPAGNLENGDKQQLIKIEGKMTSVEELSQLVIRSNFSGERVFLGDLAEIVDGEEETERLAYYDERPSTMLVVTKKAGADIMKMSEKVSATIGRIKEKYGDKVDIVIFNNEGDRVVSRVDVLNSNAMSGFVLVVIFLLMFLPGRVGLMAAASLPLAVLAAMGMMSAYGLTLNTITILALVISIGMLVDNAVVISENFVRLTSEGYGRKGAAIKSVKDLWLPITATAFTTVAAFMPMLVTKGIIGAFIVGIPIVVSTMLLISLLESFFLLPTRLVLTHKKGEAEKNAEDWFSSMVAPAFESLLARLLKHRYLVLGGFTGLLVGSIVLMTQFNKFVLFPPDQVEIYVARLEMPEGTRIETTGEAVVGLQAKIKEELGEELKFITAAVGYSENGPGDPKARRGENVGVVRMFMTEEAKNNLRSNDVLNRLRMIEVPDSKDLAYEALANGPPVGDPITGVFRSNNVESLDAVTGQISERLSKINGIKNVRVDDVVGAEEVHVEVDQVKAAQLGLDLNAVGQTVRVAVAGLDIADVNLNNKEVDYFVRFSDKDRESLENLRSVKVMDQRGELIPITQVARFETQPGTPQIKRFDFKRAKTITGSVDDDIITAVEANALLAEYFQDISGEYKDVALTFGGEGERIQESMTSLVTALVLALVLIFALLVFLFKSYIRPLIILTTIPLGLVGVSIAFLVHGRAISFLAVTGIIGLAGIIVNAGIVLISFIETLKKEEPGATLSTVLVKAASLRLRAVVVTSLTTIGGLLPTAYGIGGSDEFIIPMTLALAWGLTSGTILSLLWVPCAYLITEDINSLFSKVLRRRFRHSKGGKKIDGLQEVV